MTAPRTRFPTFPVLQGTMNPALPMRRPARGNRWRGAREYPSPGRLPGNPCKAVLAGFFALATALTVMACSADPLPDGQLPFLRDDQHSIANPSKRHATATGIGCAFSREEALTIAHKIAQFNLRGLTGQARYRVEFRTLKIMPEPQRICIEVSAQAMP